MWFTDKLGKVWVWIQGKWVALAMAISVLGAVGVNEILKETPLSPDHILKAPPEKIIDSREVDWKEMQPDGKMENKGKIIQYAYISEQEIGQAEYGIIKEELSKRTGNAQFFKKGETTIKGKKQEKWVAKVYGGTPFIKETDGKWYQTEIATTTIEAFQKQVGKNIAYADTATSTYSGAGDGYVAAENAVASWGPIHDQIGDSSDYVGLTANAVSDNNALDNAFIYRGILPFYTAGIPAGATITTSTLFVYVVVSVDEDNDGNDYVAIVETFQASHTALVNSDYADVGYGDGGEIPGQATSTNIVIGGPERDLTTTTINAYRDWGFNSIGLGWITRSGETSTCGSSLTGWTCLGLREGHDIVDNPIGPGDKRNNLGYQTSEYAGITRDPYMTIEYTIPSAAVEPDFYNLIWFE